VKDFVCVVGMKRGDLMAQSISRRRFLAGSGGLAVGLTGLGGCQTPRVAKSRRPNIVLIMADDLGYGDVGCYGCRDTRTPNIDRIAAEGVRFTSFYANAPECTPTRTALLTGRYQHRVGGLECAIGTDNVGRYDDAVRLGQAHDLGLPASETSLATMLRSAGYATAVCGKWHLGYEAKFFPSQHGFDYWFGPVGGATDYFHHCESTGRPALYRNGEVVTRDGYLTDLITAESVEFLRGNAPRPFFLYVAYTAPHTPYLGPNDRRPAPVPESEYNKGTRDTYVAMVERMDEGIGAILRSLDDTGVARETLVVFLSDNGAANVGRNTPFSGNKGNVFEGGIRVPCATRWPGVLAQGAVSNQACMTMDFSSSLVRAAGAQASRPFDGIDILKLAEAGSPARPRTLFWRIRRGDWTRKAVRDGDLKYIALDHAGKVQEYLFDLQADPREKADLLTAQPETTARLRRRLKEWENMVRPGR